jgi:carbonic anhydrase
MAIMLCYNCIFIGSDSSKGSEHTVDGKPYSLEMHMVHIKEDYLSNSTAALDDDQGYAVIALFFQADDKKKKGRTLKKVSEFVQAVSEEEIETEIDANLRVSKLVRFKKINWNNYYHYMGGFTTPSCYEVANWILMREPLKVSESFLEKFRSLSDEGGDPLVDNFRPTQPLNGRTVFLNGA